MSGFFNGMTEDEYKRHLIEENRDHIRAGADKNFDWARGTFKRAISENDYAEVIRIIKKIEEYIPISAEFQKLKFDWWQEYFKINLSEKPGELLLKSFDGKIRTFSSRNDLYKRYVEPANKKIWIPFDNVFTKILVEIFTEKFLEASREFETRKRIEFIREISKRIKKETTIDAYLKKEVNEHLEFLKSILDIDINHNDPNEGGSIAEFVPNNAVARILESFKSNDIDDIFDTVKSVFSSIPYQIFSSEEAYFHSIFHVILFMVNDAVHSEVSSNIGRADTVVETATRIFIFEYKLTTAKKGLNQIKEKKYFERYVPLKKEIVMIGVSFNFEEKNVSEWVSESIRVDA